MKIILSIISILVFQYTMFAQTNVEREIRKYSCSCENKKAAREYFEQVESEVKFIAECERESEEKRKALNLPKPPRISGFTPTAVNLVKPYYPATAKKLRIYGEVLIEVITDEKGFVIYSKIIKGNAFLREAVRKAACLSKFTPTLFCGKPVKRKRFIKYNFILN